MDDVFIIACIILGGIQIILIIKFFEIASNVDRIKALNESNEFTPLANSIFFNRFSFYINHGYNEKAKELLQHQLWNDVRTKAMREAKDINTFEKYYTDIKNIYGKYFNEIKEQFPTYDILRDKIKI